MSRSTVGMEGYRCLRLELVIASILSLVLGLAVGMTIRLAPAAVAAERITFTFAAGPAEQQVWNELVDRFNNSQRNVQVRMNWAPGGWDEVHSKTLVGIAAGAPPDVVRLGEPEYGDWVRADLLTPLTPLIQKDHYDLDQLVPQIIEPLKVNGQLYGFPQTIATRALAYNKTLMDNAGIRYPTPTWRWQHEVLDAAKKLTDTSANRQGIGFWFNAGAKVLINDITEVIWSFGGDVFSRDNQFVLDSTESKQAVQFLLDLIHKYKVYSANEDIAGQFWGGRLGMWNTGIWDLPGMRSSRIDYDYAPTPQGPKGAYSYITSNGVYVIPKGAKTQAAWQFITYLMSEEGQDIFSVKAGSGVPVRKDLLNKFSAQPTPPTWTTFVISVQRGRMVHYPPNLSRILDALDDSWNQLYLGTISLDTWLEAAKPVVNKILAEPVAKPTA